MIARILVVMCILTVVLAPAWAIELNQSYIGPLKFKFSNYDASRIYMGPDGTYTANSGPGGVTLTDLKNTPFTSPNQPYGSIAAPDAQPGEDAWGLFELTTILGQSPNGAYDIVLWEKGGATDTKPDVVGMFYGIVDQQVTLTTRSDGLKEQEIWASGDQLRVDFYEVPNGSVSVGSPFDRTALDEYSNWTTTPAILLGNAVADQIVTPIPPTTGLKFWSKTILNPAAATIVPRSTAEGTAKLFVDWYGGSEFAKFSIPGQPDLEFTTHVFGNETIYPWTANTDDPAFGAIVPEPVTILGCLLASGSLSVYMRRRKGQA